MALMNDSEADLSDHDLGMDGDLSELSDVEDYDSSDNVESSELEASQSDDSDFVESAKAKRLSKRRKTDASTKKSTDSKKGPSRRVQGRLRDMLVMPLDVLYEIFYLLAPADLLRLARTSKNLRNVLMSRRSQLVWKTARTNVPGPQPPQPPTDMSEPSWAHLLFGGANCYKCGVKGIHKIDFGLRMRLCVKCKKNGLVYAVKFHEKCSDMDPDVLNFLEYTHTGGWSHGHASNSKFYWKPSIDTMNARLTALKLDVVMNKPNARTALDDFRQERILHVDSVERNRPVFENWVRAAADWHAQNKGESRELRLDEIRKRLVALGYNEQDTYSYEFLSMNEIKGKAQVTDRIWARIRGNLESCLTSLQEEKLAAQRRTAQLHRTAEAQRLITDFTRRMLPMQHVYLPSVGDILEFPCFKLLIDRDPSFTVTAADWGSAMANLPALLMQSMHKTRDKYIAMLPFEYRVTAPAMQPIVIPATPASRSSMSTFAGPLELAVSVFLSDTGRQFIGREIYSTLYTMQKQHLKFSYRGSAAAAAIAVAANMDPHQATTTELDASDPRFFCTACYEKNGGVVHGLHVYSWRACVDHYVQATDHLTPRWMRLTPEDAASVKTREPKDRSHSINRWYCNHCAATPFGYDRQRHNIVAHVRTAHGISNAVDNQDLFYRPRAGDVPILWPSTLFSTKPQQAAVSATTQISCLHCSAASQRRFVLGGVIAHLRDKHKVLEAKQGVDYLCKDDVPSNTPVPAPGTALYSMPSPGNGLPAKPVGVQFQY